MKEKFIIEITDPHTNLCYFNGIIHNQIQIVYGFDNAKKMNLQQSILYYDQCNKISDKLCLFFNIKEI